MSETQVIYDSSGKRRVTISGADGSYTFLEEHFSDEPLEMCWVPQTHRRSVAICSSFQIAIREARGRVEWLAAAMGEG